MRTSSMEIYRMMCRSIKELSCQKVSFDLNKTLKRHLPESLEERHGGDSGMLQL